MDETALISAIADEVRAKLEGESSGHDWWHIDRVWRLARRIGRNYNVNMVVIELAALLHDIADWKFYGGDEEIGPRTARSILEKHDVPDRVIDAVTGIIREISFKGADLTSVPSTLEGQIVQDADRLDAIGAIGVARAFAYGGHVGNTMHDPATARAIHANKEAYISNRSTTINHFHEKLLLLNARMNTPEARAIAHGRHEFLRDYLERFGKEWQGLA
jgi:uncharacterized protein